MRGVEIGFRNHRIARAESAFLRSSLRQHQLIDLEKNIASLINRRPVIGSHSLIHLMQLENVRNILDAERKQLNSL